MSSWTRATLLMSSAWDAGMSRAQRIGSYGIRSDAKTSS